MGEKNQAVNHIIMNFQCLLRVLWKLYQMILNKFIESKNVFFRLSVLSASCLSEKSHKSNDIMTDEIYMETE